MTVLERFGASLRRAPWVWFALTLLVLWLLQSFFGAVFSILDRPDHGSETLTWLGVALVTTWFAAALMVAPRLVYDRPKSGGSSVSAATRWIVAVLPALGSIAFAAFGAHWVPLVGLLASIALLVIEARAIAEMTTERPR